MCKHNSVVCKLQSSTAEKFVDAGSKTNDNLLNTNVCDPHQTTCFVENESIVESNLKDVKISNNYEIRCDTIKDFLARPYLLTSFQWTSASAENANLYAFDIGALLTTVTAWADKIKGFELVRGTFHCRIQINASPFQAGRLLIHTLPNYSNRTTIDSTYPARYNTYLVQKFQHPHIELDCRDGVAILSIPYISPAPYFDRLEGYDWGRIFVDVVSPFASGAAGILNAEVTIFGYWSNFEMSAPLVPQSSKKEKLTAKKGKSLEEKEEGPGPVQKGLMATSIISGALSKIPDLEWLEPLSWVTAIGAGVCSIFGWSKPRSNEHVMIMARQPMRYSGTADGTDVSFPTSLICNNAIETTDAYSFTSQDEMSLKYLLKIPYYSDKVTWTTSQASGALINTIPLRPQSFRDQNTTVVGAFTHTHNCGTPLYYLSNFFSLYRGSINLHLKFVKTIFHSGKLLITYTPVVAATPATVPDVSTSVYSLREIVDIRESSEIILNLPYMLSRPYIDQQQYIGTVHVYVLNDLRCPETVAQSIDMLTFITAGDDFEFQVPQPLRTIGPGIFTPQSNKEEIMVDAGIADGKIQPCDTNNSKLSIGEHFLSVKQLLNRNSIMNFTTSQTYASLCILLYPWYVAGISNAPTVGTKRTTGVNADAFSLLAPMYNFFRGKARVAVITDSANNINMANIPYLFKDNTTAPFFTTSSSAFGQNATYSSTLSYNNNPFQTPVPTGSNNGFAFQHVPYYNKYPVSFVETWQGDTTNFFTTDETVPLSSALFSTGTNFGGTTTIQRSFCDDFQLTYFIGCPPLYVSTA